MMRNAYLGLISIMACTAALGCSEDVGSDSIRTSGIHAIYEAVARGDGETEIDARLRVGGNNGTRVVLEDGDELIVTDDDTTKTMTPYNNGKSNEATLPGDEGGKTITISFEREVDEDAPDSIAVLPEPFTPEFPDADDQPHIERGTSVDVAWDPEGPGEMEWHVSGSCIWNENGSTKDNGELTIPASAIEVQSSDEGKDCEVSITLDRISEGDVDTAFGEGGTFEAIQRRTLQFISTPSPSEDEPS